MFWIFGRPVEVCQAVNKNFMVVCVMFVILLTFQNVTSEFFLILNIYSLSYVSARNFCFLLNEGPTNCRSFSSRKNQDVPFHDSLRSHGISLQPQFLKKKKKKVICSAFP